MGRLTPTASETVGICHHAQTVDDLTGVTFCMMGVKHHVVMSDDLNQVNMTV